MGRLVKNGARVTIALLGEGPTSRDGELDAKGVSRSAAVDAASCLGIEDVRLFDLPDNAFDSVPLLNITKIIENIGVEPDLVITHHAGDLNIDHVLTHRAVMTAFRPLPGTKPAAVMGFEVLSSTEYTAPGTAPPFVPNIYVDIDDTLELKQEALRAYSGEMRAWPHPRSHEAVEYLARLRGSQCGRNAAEGFVIYRCVI